MSLSLLLRTEELLSCSRRFTATTAPWPRSSAQGEMSVATIRSPSAPPLLCLSLTHTPSLLLFALVCQWGKTALMYAASKGDAPAMRILLEAGADCDTRDHVLPPPFLLPLFLPSPSSLLSYGSSFCQSGGKDGSRLCHSSTELSGSHEDHPRGLPRSSPFSKLSCVREERRSSVSGRSLAEASPLTIDKDMRRDMRRKEKSKRVTLHPELSLLRNLSQLFPVSSPPSLPPLSML
jgi:hypothetical protein